MAEKKMSRLCRTNETLLYIYDMSNTQHTIAANAPQATTHFCNGVRVDEWNKSAHSALVQRVDDITSDRLALRSPGMKLRKLSTLMMDEGPAICVEIENNNNGSDQWRAGMQAMADITRQMMHHGMVCIDGYHYMAERDWTGARVFFVPFTALCNG